MIKDIVGTEINVGDIVVFTGTYASQNMGMVTRLSAERVQIGGGGYSHSSSVACVTKQYIEANGQAAYDKMYTENAEFMNHSPVQKKMASPLYALVRIPFAAVSQANVNDKFYVIMCNGQTKDDKYRNLRDKMSSMFGATKFSGFKYHSPRLYSKASFVGSYSCELHSKTQIKDMNLDHFIDQVVPNHIIDALGFRAH